MLKITQRKPQKFVIDNIDDRYFVYTLNTDLPIFDNYETAKLVCDGLNNNNKNSSVVINKPICSTAVTEPITLMSSFFMNIEDVENTFGNRYKDLDVVDIASSIKII